VHALQAMGFVGFWLLLFIWGLRGGNHGGPSVLAYGAFTWLGARTHSAPLESTWGLRSERDALTLQSAHLRIAVASAPSASACTETSPR
jgi:hypothetical protein